MSETEIKRCEDALRLLAAHLDGELDGAVHAELERHLSTCKSCYSRAEFEKRLKASVANVGRVDADPELAARIRTLIEQFTFTTPD